MGLEGLVKPRTPKDKKFHWKLPPLLPPDSQEAPLASCTSCPRLHRSACSPKSFSDSSVKWLSEEAAEKGSKENA